MRYITKVAIAIVAVAATVFVTTYAAESTRLSWIGRQRREILVRGEEMLRQGEVVLYCGPMPVQTATAFGLLALVAAPIVLVTARGIWRLYAKHQSVGERTGDMHGAA